MRPTGSHLSALAINCTLKASPERSNTDALAAIVMEALSEQGVSTETVRALDYEIRLGVTSDEARDQLYNEAKQLGVEGRSKMNKSQLQRAVAAKKS